MDVAEYNATVADTETRVNLAHMESGCPNL